MLRNYGSSVKYVNEMQGVNSRLDPIHAAVLRVKLAKVAEWNERRRRIAAIYSQGLKGTSLGLPSAAPGAQHVWHLYVVTHGRRDALQKALGERGIGTLIHYPIPPFRQQAYREMEKDSGRWPIADRLAREVLSLPMGPHLSIVDAEAVVSATRDALTSIQ